MDIRKLQRAIVDGLEDVKAHQIVVFNTEHLSPLFERVIIASGTSNRQTRALAASVRESVRNAELPVLSTEGLDNAEWVIVDCGAAVAHIMQPGIRDYYRLEEIWGGKPVRMKLADETAQRLPKAAVDEPRPVATKGGKAAAKVAAKVPAKAGRGLAKPGKVAAKAGQASGGRRAAAPAAKKATPAKTAGRGRTTVESGRAKAPASTGSSARKSAAKTARPAARKTVARKAAAR